MANLNDIRPFPNPGVRLIKEDEHVAIWEEVFEPGKPTPPHRHMRDYIAVFPNGGELTITPLAGEPEEYTVIAGELQGGADGEGSDTRRFECGSHASFPGACGRDWPHRGE